MPTAIVTREWVIELAKTSGAQLLKGLQHDDQGLVKTKRSAIDLVTDYDQNIENELIQKIRSEFPTHQFICEESSAIAKDGPKILTDAPTWIIDPIDGTTNFVHRNPHCCVSIAFADRKNIQIGCIYCPAYNELYSAERGKGAFLNDAPIRASSATTIEECIIASGFSMPLIHKLLRPNLSDTERMQSQYIKDCVLSNVETVIQHSQSLMSIGSCALSLCYVARGIVDAFLELELSEWDMAAGILIVEEAGGICMNVDGTTPVQMEKHNIMACATSVLAATFRSQLQY